MFIVFPFVIIASFFGEVRGGNFIYILCHLWADTWLFMVGIRHKNIYEQKADPEKHYIFICNHISYIDIPVLLKIVRQPMRVLGKYEMEKVPVFGFIYKKAAVTVNRKDAVHRAQSIKKLLKVLDKNISVFIFPEGTFNQTEKPLKDFYDGAFRIAIETQTPLKPVVYLDGKARLNYKSIFSLTPGISRAVHLKEIKTTGMTLDQLAELKQKAYDQMENALLRYK